MHAAPMKVLSRQSLGEMIQLQQHDPRRLTAAQTEPPLSRKDKDV
jgi:hypothetical protein